MNRAWVFAVCCSCAILLSDVCLNGNSSEAPPRLRRASLTEEAEKILRQGSSIDVNNVGQLIELVEKNGADECLARVICELTQNGRSHGDAGTKFAQSLLRFRQTKHAKIKKYTDAMAAGAKAKSGEQCKSHYSRCTHSTQEVVTVGNKLLATKSA